jgi:L-fuculose-phosphate aldolase
MILNPSEQKLREEIVLIGKLMYDKGLIVAVDGNISTRLDADRVLLTPSGLCKGMMTADQLIIVDLNGRKVGPVTPANQNLNPTSETPMHLEVYKQRPDVQAVVHAHPPYTIALSIAGISLAECMIPETIVNLGLTPTLPYATPASPENAAAIRDIIKGHDALILERHGSLTTSAHSPLDAYYRTEMLEQAARITYMFKLWGGGQPLPAFQVQKLLDTRRNLGLLRLPDEAEFRAACGPE